MGKFKFYFFWLSLVCVAVFMLQNLPGIPGFTDTFVLNKSAIYGFQIWRFVTAIFLHGSLTHLLYNLFALLFFGVILEKIIGSRRFLIVFFASGIIANIISVNFYNSSLGASGAIYGILGCLAILNPMMMVWAFGLILPMFIAAILWVAGDLLRMFGLFDPGNIGSVAHLSGIIVGIVIGIILRLSRKTEKAGKIRGFGREKPEKIKISETYIQEWEDRHMK